MASKYDVPKSNSATVVAVNNSTSTDHKRRWIRTGQHEDLDAVCTNKWQGDPRKGSSVCQRVDIEISRPQVVGSIDGRSTIPFPLKL